MSDDDLGPDELPIEYIRKQLEEDGSHILMYGRDPG
jgi:hypothetical protein